MFQPKIFILSIALCQVLGINYKEDIGLTTPELIEKHGYTVESHDVQTDDGYILTVFRMPSKHKSKKNPIFLLHGILTTSADFIALGPGKALGYILNDVGYDVWIGNRRGNYYSLKHTTLDPIKDAKKYWNFTLSDIGKYDVPACIDYILNATNSKQLTYLGYSEGNEDFFVGLTERPDYNKKIDLEIALAPPYSVKDMKAPLFILLETLAPLIKDIGDLIGVYALYPARIINTVLSNIYRTNIIVQEILNTLIFLSAGGFDYAQLNNDFVPVLFSNTPSGVAFKVLVHFAQIWHAGQPQKYDYGSKGNRLEYGQSTPPAYNYSKVTVPTVIFIGKNDWLVSDKEALSYKKVLPNVLEMKVLPYPKFNHIDFVYAKDAHNLVYKYVLKALKKYGS